MIRNFRVCICYDSWGFCHALAQKRGIGSLSRRRWQGSLRVTNTQIQTRNWWFPCANGYERHCIFITCIVFLRFSVGFQVLTTLLCDPVLMLAAHFWSAYCSSWFHKPPGRSLLIGAKMTCVQKIVQHRFHFWSSKLQRTKGSPISIASPLGTLAPAGASKVECNDTDRHTWLGHNFFANALEDIGANHLVFGVLACQGTRSAINFRPGGERYCQTLGYSYPQGQALCILVVFHGICQGAWSHEERGDDGNDGELHDEDK